MTEQCVIPAASSQYMESDGNVLSAPTMIYAQSVIMVTNTTYAIVFIGSQLLEVKGM